MTQPRPNIDELLTQAGKTYRAGLPQRTPEEKQAANQRLLERLNDRLRASLDAAGTVACSLCFQQRPRTSSTEHYSYPANECTNAREPWHYHRTYLSRKADEREGRRQKRRLRKGRPIPAQPSKPVLRARRLLEADDI